MRGWRTSSSQRCASSAPWRSWGRWGSCLPALIAILPWLTLLAALGLLLTMIGAALTHLRRAGYGGIAVSCGPAHPGRLRDLWAVLRPAGLISRFVRSLRDD